MKDEDHFGAEHGIYIGGTQIFGNLYGVSDCYLIDKTILEKAVRIAAQAAKMHIVKLVTHTYKVKYGSMAGFSIIAFLEESHVVLHTWPEGNYVTIDIFSCGKKSDAQKAFRKLISLLKPKRHKSYVINRGYVIKS